MATCQRLQTQDMTRVGLAVLHSMLGPSFRPDAPDGLMSPIDSPLEVHWLWYLASVTPGLARKCLFLFWKCRLLLAAQRCQASNLPPGFSKLMPCLVYKGRLLVLKRQIEHKREPVTVAAKQSKVLLQQSAFKT